MSWNIPKVGDKLRLRKEFIEWYNRNYSTHRIEDLAAKTTHIEVTNIERQTAHRVMVKVDWKQNDTDKMLYSSAWALRVMDGGWWGDGNSPQVFEPLLGEKEETAPKIILQNNPYCSCDSPRLVRNFAGGQEFSFCQVCKKERP